MRGRCLSIQASIGGLSVLLLVLSVLQISLVATKVEVELAATFFFLRAVVTFVSQVAGSSITIKTYASALDERLRFDATRPIFELVATISLGVLASIVLTALFEVPTGISSLVFLLTILSASTSIFAFLRLFDGEFIFVQLLRVASLVVKVVALLMMTINDVAELLVLFLLADLAVVVVSCWRVKERLGKVELDSSGGYASLTWGAMNASIRSLPRVCIFAVADATFDSRDVVSLRMLLLPREYLAKAMAILQVMFFRRFFGDRHRWLPLQLIVIAVVFQGVIVWGLFAFGVESHVPLSALALYLSAALVYAVAKLHWSEVASNNDAVMLSITASSILLVALVFVLIVERPTIDAMLFALAMFNGSWVGMLVLRRGFMSQRQSHAESRPVL